MAFQDLDEFFDSSLRLPIRGVEYVIESPDAETGLWAQRLLETAVKAKRNGGELDETDAEKLVLSDADERSMYERLLGAAFDQMVADGVPWEYLKHAGVTALMWAAGNVEAAEKYWASGGQTPDPTRPVPQDRKPKTKSARQGSRAGSTPPQVVAGTVVSPGDSS